MRPLIALLGVALAINVACRRGSLDPFPDSTEAAGWSKGRVRNFAASELWRYVDGDAERYLAAGVERTLTAEYRHAKGAEAVVDVHVMKTAEGARRLLESESALGSQPIPIGEEGRSYGASLTFRRGRCFVRVTGYEDSAVVRSILLELARATDRRLERRQP